MGLDYCDFLSSVVSGLAMALVLVQCILSMGGSELSRVVSWRSGCLSVSSVDALGVRVMTVLMMSNLLNAGLDWVLLCCSSMTCVSWVCVGGCCSFSLLGDALRPAFANLVG